MYHELEIPERCLCLSEPGNARYAVFESEFREQVQYLKKNGYEGVSVGQALEFSGDKSVAITFDDGSETDLLAAAPILRQAGFIATFYITSGWLGQAGHLSAAQLLELSRGFEIGSHSVTHAYLTDLDDTALQHEIVDSKTQIEQIIGKPVEHFSCPGGRYDDRIAKKARAAGYKTVATSRIHGNSADTDVFALGRVPILRGLPISDFGSICNGQGLFRIRTQSGVRDTAKRLLGSSLYDRLRSALLRNED